MDWKHIADLLAEGNHLGFELKNLVVWDKGKGGMGALYRSAYELIAVFKHGRDRHNIWRYAGMNRFGAGRDRALSLHATVKPVELLYDLLVDASNHGDIVFDGFGGSGSMLIAAHKMGRKARLVELEPRYCDVAIQRYIDAFASELVERGSGLSFSELAARRRGRSPPTRRPTMPSKHSDRPYEVGKGKPPVHTRFGPDRLGNRGGRPKGARNADTVVTLRAW